MTCDAFGQPTRVHKDQCRPMRLDQIGQPAINLRPDLIRHHGFERRTRQLNRHVHFAGMSRINNGATRIAPFVQTARADQKPRHLLDRFLRRGQTDALHRRFREGLQTFHAQRQV